MSKVKHVTLHSVNNKVRLSAKLCSGMKSYVIKLSIFRFDYNVEAIALQGDYIIDKDDKFIKTTNNVLNYVLASVQSRGDSQDLPGFVKYIYDTDIIHHKSSLNEMINQLLLITKIQ